MDGIAPGGDKIAWSLATTTGVDAINLAVSKHIITSEAGAKLKLKFVQDVAENGVIGWINDQTVGTMVSAFQQMDKGVFDDLDIFHLWIQLDEKKKLPRGLDLVKYDASGEQWNIFFYGASFCGLCKNTYHVPPYTKRLKR